MQQKVDLNALRALSSRLKKTDIRLEQQISEMQRTLKALLSRIRSDYPERYVHTAIEHAEGELQEVWKLAIRISEHLSKQSGHLNWSAEHYLRNESLLKNLHLQNPLLQATKTASFTAMTRFTGNTGTTDPPTKRNLISASETLLSRLKQLWWKFYDGLLMKKLGEYQQDDPRITNFIQTIENGTLLEQKEAREKLSVILHAFEEIARSQTAYSIYKQFGNEQNTLAALKNADEQRRVLAELGVSKQWYASGVDLSRQYPNSPLSACGYNPLQDGATMPAEAELRMAITLGLKNEPYREWAKMNYNEIEQAVKQAAAVREKERQIAEYKRLNDPPTELPDGTLITPKNKENETTYDYFVERIYDQGRWDANLLLEYDTWLNDTYGKTEWRKKVELADRVTYEFASSLIKETIMGGVDAVKFGYKLVVDPQQTTQEILDSAAYLVNNPEVLVEAARTVYKNFEEGTPEERAGMLGSVASVLVPGVSVIKVGKVSKVTGGLQDASKLIDKVQDVNKVFRKPESLADLLPFTSVVTPDGVRMIVRKEFPGQGQVHRVEAPEGSRGVGNDVTKFNEPIKIKTNKGIEVEFTNPSRNTIKWVEQNPKNIPNAIESAKNSSNAGKAVEGKVGNFVQQKTEVTGFGVEVRNLTLDKKATDIDIVTKTQVIEVKKSVSAVKTDQIDRLTNPNNIDFFNYESKEVILYIDEPLKTLNKFDIEKIEFAKSKGVTIVNSLEDLGSVLK